MSTAARVATVTARSLGAVAVAGGVATLGLATYFVRQVVTPERDRPDDTTVREVASDAVTLVSDVQTSAPGRYGLWLDDAGGHARLGEVVSTDEQAGTVTRVLDGVDRGELRPGGARWSGYYFAGHPRDSVGLAADEVQVQGPIGELPAWLVPAEDGVGARWAVLVHGRGAQRDECLRGLRPLHDAGLTSLVVSYRNDGDAPASMDGRYALGLREWEDVEAAMQYALDHGATELVLMGWSMGGAIVLQTLDRSSLSSRVSRVVLDAPVVDWKDVLRHHASLNRLPAPISALGSMLLGGRPAHRFSGVGAPIDMALTDWVARSEELQHPVLLIHSVDDEFVPVGPSEALAQARPDVVTLERWTVARHCREWNVDPERWERVVREYCAAPAALR